MSGWFNWPSWFQEAICPDDELASGPFGPSWCPDGDLASVGIIRGPSPCGLLMDSMRTPCGLHEDSLWTPWGIPVDSIFTVVTKCNGIHQFFWDMTHVQHSSILKQMCSTWACIASEYTFTHSFLLSWSTVESALTGNYALFTSGIMAGRLKIFVLPCWSRVEVSTVGVKSLQSMAALLSRHLQSLEQSESSTTLSLLPFTLSILKILTCTWTNSAHCLLLSMESLSLSLLSAEISKRLVLPGKFCTKWL